MKQRTEDGVNATVVFWVVRDLSIFAEDDFSSCCNHPQLRDIDFNNRSLRHDAKLRVHGRLRVLFDTQYLELESGFQIGWKQEIRYEQKDEERNVRCVTLAFLYRRAVGRMNLSIFTGFRVKPSPTNVALVTIRFQALLLLFPVLTTLNISSSAIPRTLGRGTAYLAALSFRFCLMALDNALASF